jgi:quercetin dioxygenase-like cupin family protein
VLEATVQARGTLEEGRPGHHVMIKLKKTSDVVMQKARIAPGGHTGWHMHPGVTLVIVKAGPLTFYNGDDPTCTARCTRPVKPSSTRDMETFT